MMPESAKELPIFMGHGTADPVVGFKIGYASYQYLLGELGLSAVKVQVCLLWVSCSTAYILRL